jgi:hypothetical protein
VVQGHRGHAHAPGALDEVEDVVAAGLGVVEPKRGDGAGEAGQQFARRPTGQAVVRCLDRFLGRPPLLLGSRGSAEADATGDLGDLESGRGVEQEMAEQTLGRVIGAAALPKGKSRLQDTALLDGQPVGRQLCLGEPWCEVAVRSGHGKSSLTGGQGESYFVTDGS